MGSVRLLAVLAAMLLLGSSAATFVHPTIAAEPTEARATLDEARTTREGLGFRADDAYIMESLADSASFPDDTFGVPMTRDEAGEVWRRLDVQDRIDPVAVWAGENLDGYAGLYMDQMAGGRPVFLVKRGADVTGLRARFPSWMEVEVREVAYSLVDLHAIQQRIFEERADLVRSGVPVITTTIRPSENAVIVGLDESKESSGDRSAVVERFGDAVRVRSTGVARDDACFESACMPTRGGIGMLSTDKGNPCTIGFTVKITQHPTLSTPRHGLLTSGHCFRLEGDPGYGIQWRHVLRACQGITEAV